MYRVAELAGVVGLDRWFELDRGVKSGGGAWLDGGFDSDV